LYTISDYNPNWDEPIHFHRGQAYLRYLFTGEKNYDKLPNYRKFVDYLKDRSISPRIKLPRYSIYQSNVEDAAYFLKSDGGHPPLNGILASLANYIFYQKLGIIGDIESYHLFIIGTGLALAYLVFKLGADEFGFFAGIVSLLALITYPLFIGEAHNNIKDPVETAFFAFTIYGFYKGIINRSWKWLLASSIFSGLALGTKFNILFVPFIVVPWLFAYYGRKIKKVLRFWKIFLIYPFVVFLIFYFSWPYLWNNTFVRILQIFGYYKNIGTNIGHMQPDDFYILGVLIHIL
jgi:4-amino-4-deoxy-L-arabinose transferase-like glycosyltransferase